MLDFADVTRLGTNTSSFDSLKDNFDPFEPRFTIDSVSTDVMLGTLQTGDTLSYVYTLTAESSPTIWA